jgi:hypothetical protein
MARTARAPEPDRARKILAATDPGGPASEDQTYSMRLEWEGRVYELSQSDIGPADDMICRAQTSDLTKSRGFTVTGMMTALAAGGLAEAGTDCLGVLIWACRRKAGDTELTITQVFNSLPGYKELTEQLVITMTPEEDEDLGGDSPEGSLTASGPSSPNGSASTSKTSTGRRSKAASRTAN